jgi:uncharacterized surface protein with fasciclin (FAS1) repeats
MIQFVFPSAQFQLGLWVIGFFFIAVGLAGCGGGEQAPPSNARSAPASTTSDTMTVARVLRTDDRFSTLAAALDSTNLDSTLAGDGPVTLFAPPNAAFDDLPEGTMPVLLTERLDRLRAILSRHVVERRMPAAALARTPALRTLDGDSLRVRSDSVLTVGPARLLEEDIRVDNGLIHVIDRVLPPPVEDE